MLTHIVKSFFCWGHHSQTKQYKFKTSQSGNPSSLLTLSALCSLPAVTSSNEYLTYRVCAPLCVRTGECPEVGEHICADRYDWNRLNNSAGGPSKCAAPLSGPACFSAPALNQSAWLKYSGDARVRAVQSAAPAGQGSNWQARAAMANQAWGGLAILHFLLSLWVGVGTLPRELGDSANAISSAMKVWCTACFIFCSVVWEAARCSGGWVFSWH